MQFSFYKSAGLFKPPPGMVENLTRKALFIFSSAALYEVQSLPESEEKQYILNELHKYSNKPLSSRNNFVTILDLNLENCKYADDRFNKLISKLMKEGSFKDDIKCVLSFSRGEKKGLYDFYERKLTIYLPEPGIKSFMDLLLKLEDIRLAVEHELTHFAQDFINYLIQGLNKDIFVGLIPSKYRAKGQDIYGRSLSDPKVVSRHELRDIEFYPNILESFSSFKRYVESPWFKEHITYDLYENFVKAWVGLPNNFTNLRLDLVEKASMTEEEIAHVLSFRRPQFPFSVLKKTDEKKWKYAVKIFWKEAKKLYEKL